MARASVETQIHEGMQRLTSAEKRAARALLANYPALGLGPVAEFAKNSGASAATVLRFVSQLGFESYPEFQRQLREELEERIKTPLQKAERLGRKRGPAEFLPGFMARVGENLQETTVRLPVSEFEAVCRRLADDRAGCHLIGGRFTDPIAAYVAAHLRVVREGVRKLEDRHANRVDQLLDIRARDSIVIFDIRRYDRELESVALAARARRAFVILITDAWISPISRHAQHVLPCSVDVSRTWDSSAVLFAVAEAMIARVTDLCWDGARARMAAKEAMDG